MVWVKVSKGWVGKWVTYPHEALEPSFNASLVVARSRNRFGGGVQHQLPTTDPYQVLRAVRRGGGQGRGLQGHVGGVLTRKRPVGSHFSWAFLMASELTVRWKQNRIRETNAGVWSSARRA